MGAFPFGNAAHNVASGRGLGLAPVDVMGNGLKSLFKSIEKGELSSKDAKKIINMIGVLVPFAGTNQITKTVQGIAQNIKEDDELTISQMINNLMHGEHDYDK
ncbi:hypothetical protein BJAS_P3972 [Bathymodiolus japonicus methanotrophic gill symbiont]|uniref:hypothetical protein n=1 Tax=Bathymodiolus japonicus methanotrophic gill symbiont TaxID=113269 RepID=UPI001B61B15E|nr:hypothetical protein [Bathymodiolus japonicus methanotrophic gill symbiont]GFO73260.1 hypothetical protein BJAS_P3972 [Bathymodiolus japonicus methanotrophic gill symbiont]